MHERHLGLQISKDGWVKDLHNFHFLRVLHPALRNVLRGGVSLRLVSIAAVAWDLATPEAEHGAAAVHHMVAPCRTFDAILTSTATKPLVALHRRRKKKGLFPLNRGFTRAEDCARHHITT